MADCFTNWKIVLAIKSDTNNVLVTEWDYSAYVYCECVCQSGVRFNQPNNREEKIYIERKGRDTREREREREKKANTLVKSDTEEVLVSFADLLILLFSPSLFIPFRIVSPYQTSTVCIQVCVILHCIIELVCFRFLFCCCCWCCFYLFVAWYCCNEINCMSWIYYLKTYRIENGRLRKELEGDGRKRARDWVKWKERTNIQKYAWSIY